MFVSTAETDIFEQRERERERERERKSSMEGGCQKAYRNRVPQISLIVCGIWALIAAECHRIQP